MTSEGNPRDAFDQATIPEARLDEAVRLTPGMRLGRYEIGQLLGTGGMGRVYAARDPALGRDVAIKALLALRGDSPSLRRFEREARLLAAVSHPNIASIYGFEEIDGAPYLVLERVEGESLAERLTRGALPRREAVAIALQVADGLEEAHAKGVIHRDLKPSNVMVGPGNRVKLVDFGLAKNTAPPRDGEAASAAATIAGTVLGTASYMSPEQIHGEEVDARTDIWAFGCLLYELLTGRQAFTGRSAPEVLAAALRDDPDWSTLPKDVPAALRRLLERCLRKDRRVRLQHIGDARVELMELQDPSGIGRSGVEVPKPRRRPRWIAPSLALLAAALAIAVGVLLAGKRTAPAPPPAVRLSLDLPRGLTLLTGLATPFAIDPSGALVVVAAAAEGSSQLYARALDDVAVQPIPGTAGAWQPFFSPDGKWIAFFADRKLKKIPVDGGTALPLCDVGSNPRGADWAPDGTIVMSPSQTAGLARVSASGGRLTPLTTLDAAKGEASHRWPAVLPGAARGGPWVLFSVSFEGASFDEGHIEAVSLATGERRPILQGAGFARPVPGHLVFVRGGQVFAVPFDAESLAVRGSPEVVLTGVRYDPQNGSAHLVVSATGTLVYGPGAPTASETYLASIQRDGRRRRLLETPRAFRDPRLSPGGDRTAVVIGTSTESDLWIVDENGTLSQITFGLSPHRPAWTPDGSHVTVGARRDGRWRLLTLSAEGDGTETVLFEGPNRVYPDAWSPDGRYLVFQEHRPDTGWDIAVLEVDASGKAREAPRPLAASVFQEANATLSADGRWLAYESDELDALVQAHVIAFPAGGHKARVPGGGARWPTWGRKWELLYWDTSSRTLTAAALREDEGHPVLAEGTPVFADPTVLSNLVISVTGARFDVRADGSILYLESSVASTDPPFARPVVVPGWAARLPVPGRR